MRQIFHALPWIPPEEPKELQELYYKYGVPVSFKSRQLLKNRGEPNKLLFITKGLAAYYIADRYKSHPSVLNLLIPKRTACDLSALTQTTVNVTTRAIGTCEVLMMPPSIVRNAMLQDAKLATLVAQHVLFKQECSIEAMVANFTLEPPIRLKTLLKVILLSFEHKIADGWNTMPVFLNNEQYGAVVNLTRVSVSRLFSEWGAEGYIRKDGHRMEVHSDLFGDIYDWLDKR